MRGWNPFGKVDMETGSFLKESVFNKEYFRDTNIDKKNSTEDKADTQKTESSKDGMLK